MGFSSVTGLLPLLLVLLPVVAVLVLVVFLVRLGPGHGWRRALSRAVPDVLVFFSLVPVVVLTLVNPGGPHGVELVPFADMWSTGVNSTTLYQNGGHIALFAPFGALLPLAFSGAFASFSRVALAAAGIAVTIEALQYLSEDSWVTSTDDVILNVLGALAGAALTWLWWGPAGDRAAARSGRS
ncbi:hypothetical protein GCM10007079_28050 [Nocardiopsis terrae]|uniref:VanZ-like domain-containing protein n=1 Tax=Nocardiopsis terrae TaxID=372655 RepID=A0ABR9HEZ2_9ACTN|nr:VanZ family protein [Nocardiopsis terrae]MBE1457588.1 hypothetical protein [Nocardiopsis terrae]GHC85309.1 hypothetical protein GCM10007079_28050 [Nocardiopsis terrae]